ncbi:DNA alkylation repair protein [Rickettsiales bacterium LUAb2]
MPIKDIQQKINTALIALEDHDKAVSMAAYMKHKFSFLGIQSASRKEAVRSIIAKDCANLSTDELINLANLLWNMEEREFHYVSIDILLKYYKKLNLLNIEQLLSLVVKKSWWDSVDNLAAVINKILKQHVLKDNTAQQIMDQCIVSENFWLRRIAIIHQLGWRQSLDQDRLFRYCLLTANENEFFIKKAIGWALRDYAKYNPKMVYEFVDANQLILAKLSYKEATKHR